MSWDRSGLDIAKGPRHPVGGAAVVIRPQGLGLLAMASGRLVRGPAVIESFGLWSDGLGNAGAHVYPMITPQANLRLVPASVAAGLALGVPLLRYREAGVLALGIRFPGVAQEHAEWWPGFAIWWSSWAPALLVDETGWGFSDEWEMWVRYSLLS